MAVYHVKGGLAVTRLEARCQDENLLEDPQLLLTYHLRLLISAYIVPAYVQGRVDLHVCDELSAWTKHSRLLVYSKH